ncbi:MAG TPA: hypothetical protein VF006_13260 [Longimicrobium sp.]
MRTSIPAAFAAMITHLIAPVALAQQVPTAEQAAIIRHANCTMTRVVDAPIYHAGGRFINGKLNMCSLERPWLDVSVGPDAPGPGEEFIFVYGRFALARSSGQHADYIFQRGRPNTAYMVRGGADELWTSGTLPGGTYTWKAARQVLPFMPTEVYDVGDTGDGRHRYLYGGLRFVPGHERDAYPLNANSIVFAIDGISFNAPHAFSSSLEYPAPGQRYVEVLYFQRGNVDGHFWRAYIPLIPVGNVAADWNRMVDSNPIFQPGYAGFIRGAIVATLLGKAIYDLANSPIGQALREQYEECRRLNGRFANC